MKALTICEPFATLICLPDDDPRAKRVENRNWRTTYRGPLLIHAGKSKAYLGRAGDYELKESDLTFGAVIGICDLAGCFHVHPAFGCMKLIVPQPARIKWPWLVGHEHTEGPYCFVLTTVRRFIKPIPWTGAHGIFTVPDQIVAEAIQEAA